MNASAKHTARDLRIGALQFEVATGNAEENLKRIQKLLPAREGLDPLDLLLLPEMALSGFDYAHLPRLADAMQPAIRQLLEMVHDITDHIALSIPFRANGFVHNRFILLSTGTGTEPLATYDKIHCIGHGGFRETDFIEPGKEVKTVDVRGWRLGLSVCYDLRFPELYRMQRPDLILLPAQWPATRHEHLLLLARARAIENQSYLILCNMTGQAGRLSFLGNSQIIDPGGTVLVDAGHEAGFIQASLSRMKLEQRRHDFPVLSDAVLLADAAD